MLYISTRGPCQEIEDFSLLFSKLLLPFTFVTFCVASYFLVFHASKFLTKESREFFNLICLVLRATFESCLLSSQYSNLQLPAWVTDFWWKKIVDL